jgi:DNA polymerase III gamma/tau subunit
MLYVCKQEGITTSKEALRLIAKKCERNPRKCLMKLEEVAKGNGMRVDISGVKMFTDGMDSNLYLDYIKASSSGFESILTYIKNLKAKDIDYKEFLDGFSGFIIDCLNVKYAINLDDYSPDFIKSVKQVFKEYTNSQFDTVLQIVEKANELVNSANGRTDFAELVLCTTAARLGKIKCLSVGLQNEMEMALLENRKGNKKGVEQKKQAAQLDTTKKVEANEDILQEVFGHSIIEVQPDYDIELNKKDEPSLSIKDEDTENETEFDRIMRELDN